MIGSGRMWVNPIAEHDLRAVRMNMKGQGLPFESILTSYLPKVGFFEAVSEEEGILFLARCI